MTTTNGHAKQGANAKSKPLNLRLPHALSAQLDTVGAALPILSRHRIAVEAMKIGLGTIADNASASLFSAPEAAEPVAAPEVMATLKTRLVNAMAAGHSLSSLASSSGVALDDLLTVLLFDGAPAEQVAPPTVEAPPTVASPITWQERLCRVLRAEVTRIGAPLVVNAEDIARLAPNPCADLTNRTIGFTFAAFSRSPQPAFGLRVENIGRGPGQPLHQYRLTAVDG